MRRYLVTLLLMMVSLGGAGTVAFQPHTSSAQDTGKTAPASNGKNQTEEVTGEQVFEANCARCHRPPMALPQRVTGTILMHMRVRARLSRKDEQLLLKYMAP